MPCWIEGHVAVILDSVEARLERFSGARESFGNAELGRKYMAAAINQYHGATVWRKTGLDLLLLWSLVACAFPALAQGPSARWTVLPEADHTLQDTGPNALPAGLNDVDVLWRVEDLIDHPSLYFKGADSYVSAPNAPALNPPRLTLSVWFKLQEGRVFGQRPLVLKSAPAHEGPMYQYGLFVSDDADYPKTLAFYLSLGGEMTALVVKDVPLASAWNCVTATYDGEAMQLYCNGVPVGEPKITSGPIDAYETPLLFGAYGNLPKTQEYCFEGYISEVVLYDEALPAEIVASTFQAEEAAYPKSGQRGERSEYAKRLDEALHENRDVWGEALIAQGGATYDNLKDQLHPLFYSTGNVYTELGVHNLLFGEDGGAPPYIIPLADGSRIAANVHQSEDFLAWTVGPEGETFGADLERLEGPYLEEGFWPVLQTTYTDEHGNQYGQESFAGHLDGHGGVVAFLRMSIASPAADGKARLGLQFGDDAKMRFSATACDGLSVVSDNSEAVLWDVAPGEHTLYAVWSPEAPLPDGLVVSEALYESARVAMKDYWSEHLSPVLRFDVPEPLVMDAQRNLLIQNLIMRWRYSLGSVVYHDSFYQPESSDAVEVLGEYGHPEAHRDGLADLLTMTKGPGYYENWERGEKLCHGAQYYYLTRDAAFIEEHTDAYVALCEEFRRQMAEDPYGLLLKQRQCGDIPEVAHYIFHQTVGWRGLRDMAEVWRQIGRKDLYEQYRPLAEQLKEAIDKGMATATTDMPDGALFIPRAVYTGEQPYRAITETRIGSYWNLVMPYGFASGYWPMDGPEMGRILDYMHNYGVLFLGLLRFNYYPTPIGSYRADGLPGYYTTGVDNVYLPAYIRMLAAQDQADRQVLTFYGKLAHGMARNTFVTGEGSTLGARPGEFYRSTYGGPTSANNDAFLLNLRLMLVRESFNHDTGIPESLFLAQATPREWLEDGKVIDVANAPTRFGPVTYRIESHLAQGRMDVHVVLPDRDPISRVRLKLRLPMPYVITGATNVGNPVPFDAGTGQVDLTGLTGKFSLNVIVTMAP